MTEDKPKQQLPVSFVREAFCSSVWTRNVFIGSGGFTLATLPISFFLLSDSRRLGIRAALVTTVASYVAGLGYAVWQDSECRSGACDEEIARAFRGEETTFAVPGGFWESMNSALADLPRNTAQE